MKKHLLKSLFLGLSLLFLAQFSFAQLNITPASGPNVCDGTAAISNPSQVIQSSITWYGNGAIIATNTYQIGNLCPGMYNVYYNQANPAGGVDSLFASFAIMGGTNPCANFNVTLTTTPCTTQSSNDGSIVCSATGGVGPYAYFWSNGAATQNLINLIPGFTYCVNVVDANNCQVMACDSMTISAPTTGDTMVVTNGNCGPTNTAIFTQELEDCNFDFNACATANLAWAMNMPFDTVQAVWNFVDTNGVVTNYTVNYYVPNAFSYNCLNLQFTLFCSVKSLDVKTILVNDAAQLSGLNELVKNPFTVINPIGSELTVQFDELTTGTMRLYNLNGQMLKAQTLTSVQQATITTANLPAGTYFFQLEVGSTVYTQKVMK